MNIVINSPALLLDRSQTIEIVNAAGAVVTLSSGCLWITMDGDPRDIVLRAGDCWQIERNGRTLVQAQSASRVRIVSAPRVSTIDALSRLAGTARQRISVFLQHARNQLLSLRRPVVPYY